MGLGVTKTNDLKNVNTMKKFVEECYCFIAQDIESAFPFLGGNETDYAEYEWEYSILRNDSLCTVPRSSDADSQSYAVAITNVIYSRVLFAISSLGLVGNISSFVVLVAIGLQSSAGRIKRVARHGLMALAVSDALICLAAVPHGFIGRFPISLTFGFSMIYGAYGEAIMSIFITSSTWITVTMAGGRYFAICRPFRARDIIRDSNAKRCISVIVLLSVLCNIPRFWWMSIESTDCVGQTFYFRWYGPLAPQNNTLGGTIYYWLYSTLVIFLPLVLLVLSSFCLVRKLRQTTSMRYDVGTGIAPSCRYITSRDTQITVTLITIATVHVICVSPAEVLSFLRMHIDAADDGDDYRATFNLVTAIFNTMQVSNFTLNFLLYAILNSSFRRTFLDLVRCRLVRWRFVKRSSSTEPQSHRLLTIQSYVNVQEMVNNNMATPAANEIANTSL